jgi:hypothetical protein
MNSSFRVKTLFCVLIIFFFTFNDAQHGNHGAPSVSSYENCKNFRGFAKLEWTITPHNISMSVSFENGG